MKIYSLNDEQKIILKNLGITEGMPPMGCLFENNMEENREDEND